MYAKKYEIQTRLEELDGGVAVDVELGCQLGVLRSVHLDQLDIGEIGQLLRRLGVLGLKEWGEGCCYEPIRDSATVTVQRTLY